MIREKSLENKSAYQIGKELGISKNTAKKYINHHITEHGLKGRSRLSKLDAYKLEIDEMLSMGIFNCVVIIERIKAMGYAGGPTILKDYV